MSKDKYKLKDIIADKFIFYKINKDGKVINL